MIIDIVLLSITDIMLYCYLTIDINCLHIDIDIYKYMYMYDWLIDGFSPLSGVSYNSPKFFRSIGIV